MQMIPTYTPRFLTPRMIKGLHLVGFSGEVESGKTFLTKHLVRNFGFTPESFANPFKMDGIMQADLPIEEVFGSGKSDETRDWLQKRGTEYGRAVAGVDVWVNYLETAIWYNLDHGVSRIVIPDARFPNELAAIRALGGVTYRVLGRGGAKGVYAQHVSERSLDGYEGFTRYLDNSPENETRVLDDLAGYLFYDLHLERTA